MFNSDQSAAETTGKKTRDHTTPFTTFTLKMPRPLRNKITKYCDLEGFQTNKYVLKVVREYFDNVGEDGVVTEAEETETEETETEQ